MTEEVALYHHATRRPRLPRAAKNEWFKLRKRLAFWLPLGSYALLVFPRVAPLFLDSSEELQLPGFWTSVFDGRASMTLVFFSTFTLILSITPEFTWRTARQNVIDGLSKAQWFWSKLYVLLFISTFFIALHVLVPGLLAFWRTAPADVTQPLLPASALAATGGLFLSCLMMGTLGLFCSVAIRKTAMAMGTFILWVGLIESRILVPLADRAIPNYSHYMDYLPGRIAFQLLEYQYYRATSSLDASAPVVAATAWVAVLLAAGYLCFRQCDL